jgi:hypothetical protein
MGLGSGTRVRDPGSGKNLFRIPDPGPGVKKAPDPGSRIRVRNTAKINKEDHTNLALPHHTERRQTKGAERETVGM